MLLVLLLQRNQFHVVDCRHSTLDMWMASKLSSSNVRCSLGRHSLSAWRLLDCLCSVVLVLVEPASQPGNNNWVTVSRKKRSLYFPSLFVPSLHKNNAARFDRCSLFLSFSSFSSFFSFPTYACMHAWHDVVLSNHASVSASRMTPRPTPRRAASARPLFHSLTLFFFSF